MRTGRRLMDNYARAILKKKILRLVRKGVLRDRNIVLFGASVFSKEIRNCLREHGFDIKGIVDNDSRKVGRECMGIKVQTPKELLFPNDKKTVVLLLSMSFYREMTRQLEQLGYQNRKNIFVLNFNIDESPPVFIYMLIRAIRGYFAYRRLSKPLAADGRVFIAPYTGIGDIFLSGLFFNEYLKRNGASDYVFVVVSGACKRTAEIFGIKNIVVVKPKVSDDIISCHRFLRADRSPVVLNDGWQKEPAQWLRGFKGLHFERVFRLFVFGASEDEPHDFPATNDCDEEVDALFREYGLIKGKTVVLSPYSNTLFDLPDDLWAVIAERCKTLGLTV